MEIIYKCLVGSKMHGLDTPESDEDIRYITKNPIRHVLSPFKNETLKVQDKNGDDIESWELCHFVKHLTQGNPTCYEVIKSPLYDVSLPWAEKIRGLMPHCFDGRKILMAHCGYTEAQLSRYLRPAVKQFKEMQCQMDDPLRIIMPDNQYRRIPKSIVAAYRVLLQGEQMLITGDFCPVIADYSEDWHSRLFKIKMSPADEITFAEVTTYLSELETKIQELHQLFDTLPENIRNAKPNIEAIEDILCEAYGIAGIE